MLPTTPTDAKKFLQDNAEYYIIHRAEGSAERGDVMQPMRFNYLDSADAFIFSQSATAPETGHGYDKTDVTIHFKNGKERRIRLDLQSDNPPNIAEVYAANNRFREEHPEYFPKSVDTERRKIACSYLKHKIGKEEKESESYETLLRDFQHEPTGVYPPLLLSLKETQEKELRILIEIYEKFCSVV